jgi:transposase
MVTEHTLEQMTPQALRELAMSLMLQNEEHRQVIAASRVEIDRHKKELLYRQAKIDQLTHEIAVTKRWKFGQHSERLDPAQASLLEETLDADIAAMESEIEVLATPEPVERVRQQPKRTALPASLPRVEFRHDQN